MKTMRLPLLAAALLAGTALVPPAEAATPKDALVMAYNIDAILTFDPAQIGEVVTDELLVNACDSLVNQGILDPTQQTPGLAESWEVSPDGKTFTFKIRKGLKHPSGNPVTAHDAAWSIRRVLWLGFGNAAQYTEWGLTAEKVEEQVVASDDHTLKINVPEAWPTKLFLSVLTGRQGVILDRKTIEPHIVVKDGKSDHGNAWLKTNTACIGPFALTRWTANDTVILTANKDYQGDRKPQVRRVIVRHVVESAAQRLQLEKGDVDIARDLNAEDLAAVDKNPKLRIAKTLRHQLNYIGANLGHPILANPDVRLAIKYLIDYKGLADTVLRYEGQIWQTFAPNGAFGALPPEEGANTFKLDFDKAKAHLAKSGVPADQLKFKLMIGTGSVARDIAQHFQENARKVGMAVEIEQMATGTMFSKMRARDFDLAYLGWSPGYPDANANASRHVFNPDNRAEAKQTMFLSWRASYNNDEMNKLVMAARLEKDENKRVAMYHQIQRNFMQDGPFAYIFQQYRQIAMNAQVKEISQNPFKVWYNTAVK